MMKKIALVGLFAGFSMVSLNTGRSISAARPSSLRPAKVELPVMRGGPCLPGAPRC